MEKKIVMAVDLGGTQIKLGLIHQSEILVTSQMDAQSHEGLGERLPEIAACFNNLLDQAGLSISNVIGMGIAVPGIVDSVHKKVLSINKKYSDVIELDLSRWVSETWNLPLFIENDTRSALLGEWKYGKGSGCNNLVLMTLGTGIGTSAVIEGNLLRGRHFQAGILGGHFTVNINGDLCNCGNYGCAEAEASTWNLYELAKKHPGFSKSRLSQTEILDFRTIFQYAERGDELAKTIRNKSLEVWSACAVNLIHAYDPDLLILGGGIMGSKDIIAPFIQSKINQHAWTAWGKVQVEAASFTNTAALLGVSSLAYNFK
ncbi:glucokinase [Pseudarcicella hirudinis]|uniref:Glucokinase n=1 Tax=Pseudarcicella hirudinis TaxID=1079859 RepID=A0A1I5TW34_9BACT|nr:ROK family protein [Pseudarcicella hirudinis]SFP87264.1 glucokinase [Pseudarcicella hirudinis]